MNRLPLSSIRQRWIPIPGIAWFFPRRLVSLPVVSTGSLLRPSCRTPIVPAAETPADLIFFPNDATYASKLFI